VFDRIGEPGPVPAVANAAGAAIALNIVLMQMARSGRANDEGGAAEESILRQLV
jgi:hypothetical protein